jgi:hypothetical protein
MTCENYPNAKSRVLFGATIPTCFLVLGVLGVGLYLSFSFSVWAGPVSVVIALIGGGGLNIILSRRILGSLPCPKCGRRNLTQKESDSSYQLLICDSCEIEWNTRICNDSMPD